MQIEVLREFTVLADCLSFRKTAEKLFMSQSGLSTHIKNLEKELGFELLERGQTIRLTPIGERFYECAQTIVSTYEKGLKECREMKANPPVRVYVGAYIPETQMLSSELDGIPINLSSRIPQEDDAYKFISEGTLDIAIMYMPPNAAELEESLNLKIDPFVDTYLVLTCVRTHPLANKVHPTKQDFNNLNIDIGTISYFEGLKAALADFLGPYITPRYRINRELNARGALYLLDPGNGVRIGGALYSNQVAEMRNDIAVITEVDGEHIPIKTSIVYRKDEEAANVLHAIEKLREQAEKGHEVSE